MKINSYLLVALVVILFSYTLADVSKQETTPQKAKVDADAKVEAKGDGGKYGVNYGGGGGNYGGGGGGGGSGWGGGCRHGCCNHGYGGSCNRCCISPEETKAFAENQAKEKQVADTNKVKAKADEGQYGVNYGGGGGGNYGGGGGGGGSGWGGGCRHGCCNHGYGGSCNRCCISSEEAKAFAENQAKEKQVADTNKVEAKADEGQYGVNYGGGGGGNYGGGGGSGWGGGCRHGCCNHGYGGSCNRCCISPEEAKAFAENQAKPKQVADTNNVEAKADEGQYGVNYGGGGGGNYGGGGGGGGSGWGGGCRHGCCNHGYGGSCNKCCISPEEAKAFAENQAKPKQVADTNKVEAKADEGQYGVNYGGGGGGNYGGGGGGGGSGWGGGCRHGCCNHGYGGSCNRCCLSPEEAKAFTENQSRP